MLRSLHPRSRVFRCLLMLGLFAWAALAFNAFAAPLAMDGTTAKAAIVAMDNGVPSHRNSMAAAPKSRDASRMPMRRGGMGHGCCQRGSCHCSSLCSGIASVPCIVLTWQPVHDSAPLAKYIAPTPVQSAPPLRPPIA